MDFCCSWFSYGFKISSVGDERPSLVPSSSLTPFSFLSRWITPDHQEEEGWCWTEVKGRDISLSQDRLCARSLRIAPRKDGPDSRLRERSQYVRANRGLEVGQTLSWVIEFEKEGPHYCAFLSEEFDNLSNDRLKEMNGMRFNVGRRGKRFEFVAHRINHSRVRGSYFIDGEETSFTCNFNGQFVKKKIFPAALLWAEESATIRESHPINLKKALR